MIEFVNRFYELKVLTNWLYLIGSIVAIFYVSNAISSYNATVLSVGGMYKPNNIQAYIGTPIHEFGHFLGCLLFQFKVTDAKFFPTKPKDNGDGMVTLGYVSYSVPLNMNPIKKYLGLMFVAVAPIFSGTFVIVMLALMLCMENAKVFYAWCTLCEYDWWNMLHNIVVLCKSFKFNDGTDALLGVLFIVLAISVAEHMTLSKQDIKGFYKGAFGMTLVFLLLGWIPTLNGYLAGWIGTLTGIITCVGFIALLAQVLNLGISFVRVLSKSV